MTVRRASVAALVSGVLAVGFVVTSAIGDEPYRLRAVVDNASGLRAGSDVRIGDVTAGEVASIDLGSRRAVVIELELDADHAPVGRDASLAISSLNLLGQKYVALDRGDTGRPAPPGWTIPKARVSTSTDLDQLLAVLDADTRMRLGILINEAGFAMTGRREDFNALLREMPRTTAAATRLLEEFTADTGALGRLVDRSDDFLARIIRERRSLSRMVEVMGETGVTVAERRAQLRETLARAPRMMQSLRGFLGELRATAEPLGPSARNITATAPALVGTLRQIEPFQREARPALTAARRVAPSLTRLGVEATPVLRAAVPTVSSLATFSRELVPLTDTLDRSVDNLFAIVHNWSRAVQFRDSFSHIFNAQAVITPETLRSLVRRLARTENEPAGDRTSPTGPRPADGTDRGRPDDRGAAERPRAPHRPDLPGAVPDAVPGPVSELLDFLLAP